MKVEAPFSDRAQEESASSVDASLLHGLFGRSQIKIQRRRIFVTMPCRHNVRVENLEGAYVSFAPRATLLLGALTVGRRPSMCPY